MVYEYQYKAELKSIETELQSGTNYIKEAKDYIFVDTNEELKPYMEKPNPTFEEVRNAVHTNKKLTEQYKMWLLEYIDEKEKKFPETDLVCFYYNIVNLEIQEVASEELEENVSGYFDMSQQKMVLSEGVEDEQIKKNVFQHECEHMNHNVSIEIEGKNIRKSTYSLILDENKNINNIGEALEEGITEYIRFGTTGEEEADISYRYKELQDIVSLYDIALEEIDIYYLAEHNTKEIIAKMEEAGIDEPDTLIDLMDVYKASKENEVEWEGDIRVAIYEKFLTNLAENWLEEGFSEMEIYTKLIEILEQGYIKQLISQEDTTKPKETDKNDDEFDITEAFKKYWVLSQKYIQEAVFLSVNQLLQEKNSQATLLTYQEAKMMYEIRQDAQEAKDGERE